MSDRARRAWDNRHKWLARFWVVLSVPALLWWKDSVLFVILLSLYANWEASNAAQEAKQNDAGEEAKPYVLVLWHPVYLTQVVGVLLPLNPDGSIRTGKDDEGR